MGRLGPLSIAQGQGEEAGCGATPFCSQALASGMKEGSYPSISCLLSLGIDLDYFSKLGVTSRTCWPHLCTVNDARRWESNERTAEQTLLLTLQSVRPLRSVFSHGFVLPGPLLISW